MELLKVPDGKEAALHSFVRVQTSKKKEIEINRDGHEIKTFHGEEAQYRSPWNKLTNDWVRETVYVDEKLVSRPVRIEPRDILVRHEWKYLLAEVAGWEECEQIYFVDGTPVKVTLTCKRGDATVSGIRLDQISNKPFEEEEFVCWKDYIEETGMMVEGELKPGYSGIGWKQRAFLVTTDLRNFLKFMWDEGHINEVVEEKNVEESWLSQKECEIKNNIAGINAKIQMGVCTEEERNRLEELYVEEQKIHGEVMAQREVFRKANPRTFGIHAVVKRNLASEQVDMEKEVRRYKRADKEARAALAAGREPEKNPFARIPMAPSALWVTKSNRDDKLKFRDELKAKEDAKKAKDKEKADAAKAKEKESRPSVGSQAASSRTVPIATQSKLDKLAAEKVQSFMEQHASQKGRESELRGSLTQRGPERAPEAGKAVQAPPAGKKFTLAQWKQGLASKKTATA